MKRLHYSAIFVSTVTILGISSLVGVVGYLQHEFTLNQEMHEVEKQALNVRQAIIDNFKAEDFAEINTKEDMDKPIYPAMQKLLNTIRISAGLRYLYTAKINSLGEYIYVIDGLDYNASDFAKPGTPIEKELYEYMRAGLRGEVMISDHIMDTEWGPVVTAYYPISVPGQSEVLGILCMEFDMTVLQQNLQKSVLTTIAIGVCSNILGLSLVLFFFMRNRKRIVTKMKQTERQADESASVLLHMTERSGVGIFALSLDEDRVLICNQEFKRIYGITDDESFNFERFLRFSDRLMPPSEYRELCEKIRNLDSAPSDDIKYEYHLQPEGTQNYIAINGIFRHVITTSGERILVISAIDVTEQNLKININNFERGMFKEALIASSSTAVLVDLHSGKIEKSSVFKASPYTQSFFQSSDFPIDLDAFLDKFCRETQPLEVTNGIRAEASVSSLLGAWKRGVTNITRRYTYVKEQVNFTLLILFSENKNDGHVYVCMMTHSLSKTAEEPSKLSANGNAATENCMVNKSIFSPNFTERVFQEINSPLNGLLNMLELVEHSHVTPQQFSQTCDTMKHTANRIVNFVNNTIYIEQIKSNSVILSRELVDIVALFKECVNTIQPRAQRQNITCIFNNEANLKYPMVYASRHHLHQIIMNLAENALNYNKENGLIIFELHSEDSAEPNMQSCRFTIKDTGNGMSEEFMEHIFEGGEDSESELSAKGIIGLGLPVVRGLLAAMHGHLRLVSPPGDGAIAEFTLSFEGALNKEIQINPATSYPLKGLSILLAEDNMLGAEILSYMLNNAGAKVKVCANGSAALEAFHESSVGDFDLVLTEIKMPVMDGLLEARSIRNSGHAQHNSIPIIALTSSASSSALQKLEKMGINDYLVKPVECTYLIQKLSYWAQHKADEVTNKQDAKNSSSATALDPKNDPGFTEEGHRVVNFEAPLTWEPKKKKAPKKTRKSGKSLNEQN